MTWLFRSSSLRTTRAATAASPRLISAERPRRGRAATLRGISTSRPRRRRGPSPHAGCGTVASLNRSSAARTRIRTVSRQRRRCAVASATWHAREQYNGSLQRPQRFSGAVEAQATQAAGSRRAAIDAFARRASLQDSFAAPRRRVRRRWRALRSPLPLRRLFAGRPPVRMSVRRTWFLASNRRGGRPGVGREVCAGVFRRVLGFGLEGARRAKKSSYKAISRLASSAKLSRCEASIQEPDPAARDDAAASQSSASDPATRAESAPQRATRPLNDGW